MYFHRLTEAIEALRGNDSEWIDRRGVEEALGVSKPVAWRILRKCGGRPGPGHALVCRREEFIEALQQILITGECDREIQRRNRVETLLGQLGQLAQSRRSKIVQGAEGKELVNTRFKRLPAGIDLTPQRMTIEFSGMQEFLKKFGAVVFALQNDFEAVASFLDGAQSR